LKGVHVVDECDASAFADRVVDLFDNPDLRAKQGGASFASALAWTKEQRPMLADLMAAAKKRTGRAIGGSAASEVREGVEARAGPPFASSALCSRPTRKLDNARAVPAAAFGLAVMGVQRMAEVSRRFRCGTRSVA
jgi:hypothetical protein